MTKRHAARVLHVVDRTSGGVPVAVATYIRNSPDAIEHHILSPFDDSSRPSAVWTGIDAEHHDLGQGLLARIAAVRRASRTVRPDVVHSHSSFGGVYGRLGGIRRESRLVYTPHCFSFMRTDLTATTRSAFLAIEWLLGWRTDLIAACSPGEASAASDLSSVRARVDVIPNVASITAQSRVEGADDRGALRVGMLGRISAQKDPEYFQRTVERLGAPSATWIGDGPADSSAGLRVAGIEVTGWLQGVALTDRLSQLDVYVHSAAWEGFPLAVLDAYAAGLPIIVRPISAFGDLDPVQTIDGSIEDLRDAWGDRARFDAWRAANRAAWAEYLRPNTAQQQGHVLSRIWRRK